MSRRGFLRLLAGLVGMATGLVRLLRGDSPTPAAAVMPGTAVPAGSPVASGTPALSAEAAQVNAILRSKQAEIIFPLAAPTDLADFAPRKVVDVNGPEEAPFVVIYLGPKADPDALMSFAQSATGYGSIQGMPRHVAVGITKQRTTLLGGDLTMVTAINSRTGAHLVQLLWIYDGRQYWVESRRIPTEQVLRVLRSVQPLR